MEAIQYVFSVAIAETDIAGLSHHYPVISIHGSEGNAATEFIDQIKRPKPIVMRTLSAIPQNIRNTLHSLTAKFNQRSDRNIVFRSPV